MQMYRTAPQLVFQFVGGFSITQYAYPILFNSPKQPPTNATATAKSSSAPSTGSVSGVWGSVQWGVRVGDSATPRSLPEDVESLLTSYRTVSAALLSFIVVSGGAPALLGAALSIYCDGTPEGMARYAKIKRKIRELRT
ncbi:hypothetical protein ABL78_3066 [Leptomonas seymouri]|uniref:Transmembrane protein n=1 Tax=Leptomonas seymouri TaxID=5684 RepID=A0A0N0P6P0_LEPSE|nr:hypothetical protein ABL78_3066 [Leptomonas seymouri]|eukprot:KPI87839.1 hypothetical protein ABL78_3066 [Leptomonas seymouri]